MRVRVLSTGSADGWPNAFCTCAACAAALARGDLRAPTCTLVDGRLLLDCGPETPRSALRCGESLAGVTHVLVTHDHPDHSAPMALLSRRWAGRAEALTVIGPAAVVGAWRPWAAPDDDVRFVTVSTGDVLDADGYQVRVLQANHQAWRPEDAVLYDVSAPDGSRLLYATDTGPLPSSTRDAVAGAGYDLALVEATFGDRGGPGAPPRGQHRDHLDLDDLRDELAALRSNGAITSRTDVVAVHLSHHSPLDLPDRLARLGARVVDDGTEIVCSPVSGGAGQDAGEPVPMSPHRTLVVGGARSGKSHVAERLLAGYSTVTYVATGPQPGEDDPEWAQRVRQHRERRPPHWTTVETTGFATTGLADALRGATTPVLVDCVGTWLTAVLDETDAWAQVGSEAPDPLWHKRFDAVVDDLIEAWHSVRVPVVAVTNEVGGGVVPASASGRLFRDELGRLTTRLSRASERVLLVVAGRTLDLSDSPDRPLQERP
ncbi:MAG TPA: bifunctional adenosylcobinamide kinase/adenosylcobinamide-phosphate guanylyltransferase [Actinomycetales bacterium]|nr:bifunctional adenosylcobinamide kinase/adenosylcobinamide-phosphate guanylyltransferase [Actinomycetales bacterium]